MLGFLSEFKALFHPYYFCNILLSASFISVKYIPPLCEFVLGASSTCEFSMWETEVLFFLLVIVMFRTRKSGSRSFIAYISTLTLYAKSCNIILWFSLDPIKGIIYVLLVLIHFLVVGEPAYQGAEDVVYFDSNGPEEEFQKNKNCYWIITFYASWSPACGKLAPIISKLSLEYSLPNLKFGKVDVARYPDLAKKYFINDTPLSLQLPTIAVYKGTKELIRRPCLDSKGKYMKFYFTEDNIRAAYDLNNLHLECKRQSKATKKEHIKGE